MHIREFVEEYHDSLAANGVYGHIQSIYFLPQYSVYIACLYP